MLLLQAVKNLKRILSHSAGAWSLVDLIVGTSFSALGYKLQIAADAKSEMPLSVVAEQFLLAPAKREQDETCFSPV